MEVPGLCNSDAHGKYRESLRKRSKSSRQAPLKGAFRGLQQQLISTHDRRLRLRFASQLATGEIPLR